MHKSKKKKNVPKEVPSQLMELSNAQTRPNLGDGDFSSMSFQDAGNVIDRDENERLQFMNSKLSFSEGIDQVEVPSLMSVTSYFQQGSSFPVPYGNDSTMFPIDNGNVSSSLLGVSQSQLSQTLKPPSRNSSRRLQRSTSLKQESSRVSWGNITTRTLDDSSTNIGTNPKSAELERNDSLAKFFLGPQSDGMDKGGIIDYVLDYCKRRASYRLSDAPGIAAPPNQNNSGSSRTSGTSTKDRGIGDEEAVTAIRRPRPSGKTEDKTSDKRDEQASLVKPNVSSRKNSSIEDEDESIMLAEAGSTKENVLEVSELGGGNDGFEKFKKNLNHGRKTEDRYRKKLQSHHTEFETKRLNVDERYSHPKLSPNAFAGPGSTASLERPKKMMCNSPPEKLLQGRHENVIDNTPSPRPTQLRNSGGQCHSTPLVNESYIGKLVSTRKELNLERHFKPEGANLNYANFDKQKRPKMAESGSESSEGNSPGLSGKFNRHLDLSGRSRGGSKVPNMPSICESEDDKNRKISSKVKPKKPTSLYTEPPKSVVPAQIPLSAPQADALAVVPIIQSALQHSSASAGSQPQQCACPHQCGQQQQLQLQHNHGVVPGVGMPIVIHIHLPYSVTPTGSVEHPVPNSGAENHK